MLKGHKKAQKTPKVPWIINYLSTISCQSYELEQLVADRWKMIIDRGEAGKVARARESDAKGSTPMWGLDLLDGMRSRGWC